MSGRETLSLADPPTDCTSLSSGPGEVPTQTMWRCCRRTFPGPWFFLIEWRWALPDLEAAS